MPLKHLLHLVDQSGASEPDGCVAELSSYSIYLGLSPRRSVSRPGMGPPHIRIRKLSGTPRSFLCRPTSRVSSATPPIRLDSRPGKVLSHSVAAPG